jgi:UDP-glucose 4-epimerase
VSDVARAFALAAQTPAANGLSVNVGSGTALSVSALADMVGGERVAAAARVNDLRATLASTCRAKEVLGFETTRDFRDALRCVLHTGPHTTALARWTPILKDFARRISPPRVPRFQSPPSTPFNSN